MDCMHNLIGTGFEGVGACMFVCLYVHISWWGVPVEFEEAKRSITNFLSAICEGRMDLTFLAKKSTVPSRHFNPHILVASKILYSKFLGGASSASPQFEPYHGITNLLLLQQFYLSWINPAF